MGSTVEFADYVLEQLANSGDVSKHRMFGEFAVYLEGKVLGFICDDEFFLKITEPGLKVLADSGVAPQFGPAYSGSKDYLIVTILDNQPLLTELVLASLPAIPAPKPKKSKRP